jgi:hypothetical protein
MGEKNNSIKSEFEEYTQKNQWMYIYQVRISISLILQWINGCEIIKFSTNFSFFILALLRKYEMKAKKKQENVSKKNISSQTNFPNNHFELFR